MTKEKISCFISYSEGSEASANEFANELAKNGGFDIKFRRFFDPEIEKEGIANFMEDSVINSDKILMVCTPEYAEKADESVGYEKMIITDDLLRLCGITKKKIIPILFSGKASESLPSFMLDKNSGKKTLKKPTNYENIEKNLLYQQIINAINKPKSGWTLGELLAPHKAKRKKSIRLSLAQEENKQKEKNKQKEENKQREEMLNMIKTYYERHQYYHTHYWKLVIKVFSMIIALMYLPFLMTYYFDASTTIYSLPPLVSAFIVVFLIMGLKSEEAQLHNIELKINCLIEVLSESYADFDPTIFSNSKLFWNKLNRYKVVNLVLFLLVGLSLVAITEGILLISEIITINPKLKGLHP